MSEIFFISGLLFYYLPKHNIVLETYIYCFSWRYNKKLQNFKILICNLKHH